MAGEKIPVIYCRRIKRHDLNVYMVSSEKGAMHVDLFLGQGPLIIGYYKKKFPRARVIEGEKFNIPLIKAIDDSLKGIPSQADLKLAIRCTSFQWSVLKTVADIPYGQTRAYGEVAEKIGKPGAARAVGQAMKKNPLPLIFP